MFFLGVGGGGGRGAQPPSPSSFSAINFFEHVCSKDDLLFLTSQFQDLVAGEWSLLFLTFNKIMALTKIFRAEIQANIVVKDWNLVCR